VFATLAINHHGDSRIALWLASSAATQDYLVRSEPKHFFVPPYLGPRGWLGLRLDKGIAWKRVATLVQDAFQYIAPARLVARLGKPANVTAPSIGLTLAELDPMYSPQALQLLTQLDRICSEFPEANKSEQFGFPVWRAGKKTFVQFYHTNGKFLASFWVGIDRQSMMTLDPRFHIPAYAGHNGWIALSLAAKPNKAELRALAEQSYRHFAQKKMLQVLERRASSARR
jgi:predicted DNA-binding protein (MmcQ/YjbR family)